MKHKFPHIETINDVLPYIKDKDNFIVIDKDDYTIIDYVVQSSDTFPNPVIKGDTFTTELTEHKILRECRGIAFNKEGKIISRPFHKFFNYGEKPEEQTDLDLPEVVLQKLDGSMIRPLVIDGDIRLATRKGITDVAMQAEEFAAGKENYIIFISGMINGGFTPIFEWCSRKNQIVLDYPEDSLTLLAVRKNDTGEYIEYEKLKDIASTFGIPIIVTLGFREMLSNEQIVETAKALKDEEGFVMVWPNGHRMKAKAEWYVTLHRAKEAIGREKDLIKAYLTTGVDDILPILPENYKNEVAHFLAKLTEELVTSCQRLDVIFLNVIKPLPEKFTRKEFALRVLNLDPKYKGIMFQLLTGQPCMEIVIPILLNACQSKKKLDEFRWLIGGIRFGEKSNGEEAA
jgi:RNA ligase